MRRVSFGWLASFVILCGLAPMARAAVQNRLAGGVGKTVVALPQSVTPRASRSTDLGEADGGTALTSITLHFSMTQAQRAALIQLTSDQQNPASARYHQWLTPEQFADQFGLSVADFATVSQWAIGQGFKVESVARSRTFIQFSGTVAQAESAFHTSIHRVTLNGEAHIANLGNVSLPSGIAGVVEAVSGLNDFHVKPRLKVRHVQPRASDTTGANPAFTSSVSGDTYIAPGDFYTIYDVTPLLSSSINGSGVSIAVAGQTDIQLTDMAAFRSASGLSANPPVVKVYGTDPGTPLTNGTADDETEADLDVEWSGAVAPSATIIYANSTDVFNSLMEIIDNKLAPIASISYGDCESAIGQPDLDTLNSILMQANSEGITVFGPAGDSGATDCDYQSTTATQGLAVDFPASSPYVTGVGGNQFNEGSGTYFGTTNNSNGGSALSYIPEAVWNSTAEDGQLAAGGGGLSAYFSKPYWQSGAGVPSDASRDVPDVALNADPDHDGYLFCSQGSCAVGFRASANGNLSVVGGTSASTPSFAGIMALVEQKIGASVGNANPVIYALANSTFYNTVFHDVQTGSNASPCTAGSTDCPTGGDIGYTAGVGYDQATGWGSVDAFNLANDWTLVTPVGTTGVGTTPSLTTVTSSNASVTSGTSVTITATVADSASNTNSTSVPTGTVQFLVNNVASGGTVALSSTGAATFTLVTTGLASGNNIVAAAYSGDTLYAGSKGSVTVDVTSATAPDFTLTPPTATVTTAAGTDAPGLVFTVTPVNGFTGPVSFSASTSSSTLNATYSFSVSPLTVTAPTAGTTTLDLSAYVADVKSGTGLARRTVGLAVSRKPELPGAMTGRGWFAGSGAALACVFLFMVPRKRRLGALLGLVISIAALGGMLGLQGCGSSSSNNNNTTNPTQTNATPGTYTIIVTATGTSAGTTVSHNATVTFVVQ